MILSAGIATAGAMMGLGVSRLFADGSSSSPTDPFNWVTGLGFPGVIIALLITGQLRTKPEVERLIAENDRKDKLIEAKDTTIATMQSVLTKQTLPALLRSAEVLEAIPNAESSLFNELRQAQQQVTDLTSRLERMTRGQ
jgi:hypothetical protein